MSPIRTSGRQPVRTNRAGRVLDGIENPELSLVSLSAHNIGVADSYKSAGKETRAGIQRPLGRR